ncbi:hypothetical protein [Paenibacillus harenae]|uniref:Uncharacterized protein n=1 Tax=Paenibacillus harenae TaxID=306543 RepID=A0ABT9U6D3_PAEHA|nr:hypothetical protein [Paenibacillus harenae]MDQ0114626.1 hypothetical protein [Paenibacillus harenae]
MKRFARIDIHTTISEIDKVIPIIREQISFENDIELKTYSNRIMIRNLIVGDSIYQSIIKKSQELGLKHKIFERREYTKKEIASAVLLDAEFYAPYENRDKTDSEELGTLYDYSIACPKCGEGKKQITDLMIDAKGMGKQNIAHHDPDIIVTEYTKNVIENSGLTGCEFRDVFDYKDRPLPQKLYQLVITSILPEMKYDSMRIEYENHCDICTRNAIMRSEIIYDTDKVTTYADFNQSLEFYGIGGGNLKRTIVSARVRDVLIENKIKVFQYEPVKLV